MTHKLPNYLRVHRKRAGLSQDEVAQLLGHLSGAHLSRYENFRYTPALAAAFAFEVIFQAPARDLFAGVYQEVEQSVVSRAGFLVRRLEKRANPPATRALEVLRKVTGKVSAGLPGGTR